MNRTTYTKDEVRMLMREHPEYSYDKFVQITGLARDIVRKRYKRLFPHSTDGGLNSKRSIMDDLVTDENSEIEAEKDIFFHRAIQEKNAIQKKYIALLNHLNQKDDLINTLTGIGEGYKKRVTFKSTSKKVVGKSAVMLLSDTHCGELVSYNETNGFNEHDPEVSKKRIEKYFVEAVKIINDNGADTLYLWIGGDVISGFIHEELLETTAMRPIDETIFAMSLIEAGIEYILNNTSVNIIVLTSNGNHGRITSEARFAKESGYSLEYFGYKMLEKTMTKYSRVSFSGEQGYLGYETMPGGFTMRYHHGHGVKGFNVNSIQNKIKVWDNIKKANVTIMGHLHQLTYCPNFITNGSTIGYNAYAVRNGFFPEPAQQGMFIVDRQNKTILSRHTIVLQ